MTREEAIKLIEHISIAFVPTDQYGDFDDPQPYEDALDMAIEALKGGDADMTVIPEGTGLMKPCHDNGADLISRADAIGAAQAIIGNEASSKAWAILEQIRSLPSAEAEWIPCSERLPSESGDYLVCPSDGVIEDYSDCSDVMIVPYDADCEAFGWWTERYDPISLGFVDSDFIAWMPLPKPYREESEAEE